jgi:hypothetical protein
MAGTFCRIGRLHASYECVLATSLTCSPQGLLMALWHDTAVLASGAQHLRIAAWCGWPQSPSSSSFPVPCNGHARATETSHSVPREASMSQLVLNRVSGRGRAGTSAGPSPSRTDMEGPVMCG